MASLMWFKVKYLKKVELVEIGSKNELKNTPEHALDDRDIVIPEGSSGGKYSSIFF